MPALDFPLIIEKSASFYVKFTVKKNAVALNLAGVAAEFRIKSAVEDGAVYATWTTGGGQVTTNAAGEVIVKVNTATVDALPSKEPLEYVVRLTGYDIDTAANLAGHNFRVVQGTLTEREDP